MSSMGAVRTDPSPLEIDAMNAENRARNASRISTLEIWTNAIGGVMLRDSTTGQCREMKDVKAVIFVDDSVFPFSSNEQAAPEPKTVRTLSGQSLKVG